MKIAFVLIGIIFVAIGVVCVYDARILTKKFFSFQDKNEGTKYLKLFGLAMAVLGLVVVYIYIPELSDTIKNI